MTHVEVKVSSSLVHVLTYHWIIVKSLLIQVLVHDYSCTTKLKKTPSNPQKENNSRYKQVLSLTFDFLQGNIFPQPLWAWQMSSHISATFFRFCFKELVLKWHQVQVRIK